MPINKYDLKSQKNLKLSDHFSVYEFASTSGNKVYSNEVRVDTELVNMLEQIYSHFNCSKIIISSGYRTPAHDKAVGGSGSGYHCTGQAADFCCYDKSGKAIPSSKIVLYLEDINCWGIGYKCGGATNYTHADTRPQSRKWWGDESKNSASIQSINGASSFYTYLGVKNSTTSTSTPSNTITVDKTMSLSSNGLNLIKSFEGLTLTATKAVSSEKYYTIGYGHYGSDVKAGQTITQAQALTLLKSDIKIFEKAVNDAVKVGITQNQFDALVSLCYNIGTGAFKSSDTVKYLNSNKLWHGAADIPSWRKSGGVIVPGLQNRRTKELQLFAEGQDFTLSDNMNVRSSASTSAKIKKVSEVTANGRACCTSSSSGANAVFKSGTVITALTVSVSYSSNKIQIWVKCPSGYICLRDGNEIYAV